MQFLLPYYYCLCILILAVTKNGESYPHGAPTSVCKSLLPHHKRVNYRENDAVLTAQRNGDSSVNVTLSSDKAFKGFIIQGRDVNENIIGIFHRGEHYKLMECNDIEGSSITHKDKHRRYSIRALWDLPEGSNVDQVTFKAVVVYKYKKAQTIDTKLSLQPSLDDVRIMLL